MGLVVGTISYVNADMILSAPPFMQNHIGIDNQTDQRDDLLIPQMLNKGKPREGKHAAPLFWRDNHTTA
jgi:hypothetical protein